MEEKERVCLVRLFNAMNMDMSSIATHNRVINASNGVQIDDIYAKARMFARSVYHWSEKTEGEREALMKLRDEIRADIVRALDESPEEEPVIPAWQHEAVKNGWLPPSQYIAVVIYDVGNGQKWSHSCTPSALENVLRDLEPMARHKKTKYVYIVHRPGFAQVNTFEETGDYREQTSMRDAR